MLCVHDAAAAIEFYRAAFLAREIGERYPWEGRVGHAELEIGGAKVMLADEFPERNSSPRTLGGTAVILHITVEDCDEVVARAQHFGADTLAAPRNEEYGRVAKLRDPYGHIWMLNGPVK
jgi:PhnB protein